MRNVKKLGVTSRTTKLPSWSQRVPETKPDETEWMSTRESETELDKWDKFREEKPTRTVRKSNEWNSVVNSDRLKMEELKREERELTERLNRLRKRDRRY